MTTEKAESKLYESLPHPNEDKPITVDTFSPWVIQIARIKYFNGVKNSPEIMAVYSHLLGWKRTTGEIRPSQQYIADCCCMGLSTVQKKVKVLVKMGWITATPARKPGSKEISHTDYTVKDPEEILAELKAGESGTNEQKHDVVEPAAPAAGKPDGVPAVDIPVDVDLSDSDDPSLSEPAGENVVGIPWLANSFTPRGDLVPEARRWAQSQGATTWQEEIKLVWKLTGKTNMGEPGEHMRPDDVPEPAPVKRQVNGPDVYHYDENDPEIPF
ncbi:hypothetical protein R0V06_000317 [Escherichia coli]|nr:hypothetical protein [Escherichia coli]